MSRIMAFSNSSRFCTVLLDKIQTLQVVNSREKHLGRLSRYNKRAYPTRKHQTFPGIVTDIKYYQDLDISHLHRWEPRSPKRKFELKLKEMERWTSISSSHCCFLTCTCSTAFLQGSEEGADAPKRQPTRTSTHPLQQRTRLCICK